MSLPAFLAGCSSQRDVNVEVELKTDDASIAIDRVHFATSNSMIGASATARPPKLESDGTVKHDHVIDSPNGNFVIVDLLRDGQPLHSEIYKLDPQILSRIGNQSEWVKPDGLSSGDNQLHWRLMKQPESFKPANGETECFTEIRYNVAKPYSY